jgi:hypothetical protein
MAEGVAVVITERALGCCTNMSKDQGGCCLGSDALKVDAVPSRSGRGKDARFRSEFAVGVISYAKAIT